MECCALASGSSGNCFYVGNDKTAVLVDAGISAKQILLRLEKVGGNASKIKGIFITHEHSDHIRGADVIARKLNVPIFATKATLEKGLCSNRELLRVIERDSLTQIEGLRIEAFSKFHSAVDPVSFNIYDDRKISVITDAGHACPNIQKHVKTCDFIYIEANHDEKMLTDGPYSWFLKKWIQSDKGHLSNSQAATCIRDYASSKLNTIILSHISATNNTPAVALQTFNEILKQRKGFSPIVEVSVREEPTRMFFI